MSILIDIIILLIVVALVIMGYVKGLTGSIMKIISFGVALLLAILLFKPISLLVVNETMLDEKIQTSIVSIFNQEENNQTIEESSKKTGITDGIVSNINKDIKNATQETKNNLVEQSSKNITTTIINIGCAIIIFIIVRIIMIIVCFFIKGVTDLPVIKQADKIGGIIYGIIESLLIIFILLSIISFTNILWPTNAIVEAINASIIGNFLYNNNILLTIIF